jgi:hypothetical protein
VRQQTAFSVVLFLRDYYIQSDILRVWHAASLDPYVPHANQRPEEGLAYNGINRTGMTL